MSMKLEMGIFPVSKIILGKRFAYRDKTLTVDADALRELALEDGTLKDVSFHAAMPGDSVRITNVLDAVEPLYKVSGRSCAFPGFLGPAKTAGQGRTHKLAGMCVISTTHFLGPMTGIMSFREGIIDMSGPGAMHCTNSETANLVACYEPLDGASNEAHDDAVRLATLKVASRLAAHTAELEPVSLERFETRRRRPRPSPGDFRRSGHAPGVHGSDLHVRQESGGFASHAHSPERDARRRGGGGELQDAAEGADLPALQHAAHIRALPPPRGGPQFRRHGHHARPPRQPGAQGALGAIRGQARHPP